MENRMDKVRADRALRHVIPAAANVAYEKNEEDLLWNENRVNNRIVEWIGPPPVEI